MSRFVTLFRHSILIATAVAASAPAFAETVESAPSIAVPYGDLDLSSTSGQTRLHHRLSSAARSVCTGALQPGTRVQPAYSACVSKAMVRADAEFALLTSKSGPKVAVAEHR